MEQKIFKLFQVRFAEAWYQLPKAEQDNLLAKVQAALGKVGGKGVLLCDSSWSSEQWQGFGVEEFPNMAAVQEHSKLLNELNWFRYIDSVSTLGTEVSM
jgi:hypothetical protein